MSYQTKLFLVFAFLALVFLGESLTLWGSNRGIMTALLSGVYAYAAISKRIPEGA